MTKKKSKSTKIVVWKPEALTLEIAPSEPIGYVLVRSVKTNKISGLLW